MHRLPILIAIAACDAGTTPQAGTKQPIAPVAHVIDAGAAAPDPWTVRDRAPLADATVVDAPASGDAAPADSEDTIGTIALHAPASEVIAALGPPPHRTPPIVNALSTTVTTWTYPGLTIDLFAHGDTFIVRQLRVASPCTLATKRGIQIGSRRRDVLERYPPTTEPRVTDSHTVIANGVTEQFTFANDRVVEIVLLHWGS